jgi:hypothetical protein
MTDGGDVMISVRDVSYMFEQTTYVSVVVLSVSCYGFRHTASDSQDRRVSVERKPDGDQQSVGS